MTFARDLRSQQTQAEIRLWYHLRDRRFMGLKFRRQKPIGRFVADFVCMAYRLVVEADGGQHADGADAQRDAWFRSEGFTVLRFWNHEVLGQTEAVLEKLREVVLALGHRETVTLTPSPSPASGRGERRGDG